MLLMSAVIITLMVYGLWFRKTADEVVVRPLMAWILFGDWAGVLGFLLDLDGCCCCCDS